MRFRFRIPLAIAITSIAVVVSVGNLDPSSIHLFGTRTHNSISGISGVDDKVLVVKIDDTEFARPQRGLEGADLVYIEQVEGGLTRLAAVFSSSIPPSIGPVRSARISDIDILSQYGYVAFAYSGAQSKFRPVLAAANIEDVGAEKLGATFYKNDPNRIQPYAMMLDAHALMHYIKEKSFPIAMSKSMGWSFGKAPESGTAISSARVSWPAATYQVTWSEGEKRWLLSAGGVPDVAESGIRLGPITFVIQNVLITPSEYHDKVGGITPLSHVIGNGTGYILRDGHYFPAFWSRPSAEAGTTWRDADGRKITFAPGQIWIALTDRAPLFTPSLAAQRS